MFELPEAIALRRLIDLAVEHLNFGDLETVPRRAEPVLTVLVMDCFETSLKIGARVDGDRDTVGFVICKTLDYLITGIAKDRQDIAVKYIRSVVNMILAVSKAQGKTNIKHEPEFLLDNEKFVQRLQQTIEGNIGGQQFINDLLGMECNNCEHFMDCKVLTSEDGSCELN